MEYIYKVIHKSLRDFRPLRYSSRDGHPHILHFIITFNSITNVILHFTLQATVQQTATVSFAVIRNSVRTQ
jgi:hypothetical protein